MAFRSFEDLEVWKRGCRLAVFAHRVLERSRDYALRDQILRAAVSIPSNIAEGHERDSVREFIRFLRIAKGSAAELRTQIYIARRLGLISANDSTHLIRETRELIPMLFALIRSLAGRGENETRPRESRSPSTPRPATEN